MFLVIPVNPPTKANVLNRIIAKLIDLGLVFAFAMFLPYPIGPFVGFFYSLFADGIRLKKFSGQSLGKKLMGLQVIQILEKRPATWKDSVFRNTPVGVATFFAIIPVWGWLIAAVIGLPLMVMEVYLMFSVDRGHRLGDVMGDTEVIEVRRRIGV